MGKRSRMVAALAVWLVFAGMLGALDKTVTDWPKLEVRLQLLRDVYRMNRPLPVLVEIVNRDDRPVTLMLGDRLLYNFRFRVRTLRNELVKDRLEYALRLQESRSRAVPARTVVLQPGERYGRTIDISPRKLLTVPDRYQLTGYFYMRPQRTDADTGFTSNSLRFTLKPPEMVSRAAAVRRDRRLQALDRRLTPGETVDFAIRAKRQRDWENYFRFMDIKQMINLFQKYAKKYQDAVFSDKPQVMQDFKDFLKRFPAEQIVHHFVQQSTVTRDEKTLDENAQVQCLIVYRDGQLLEKKIYHFSLYRQLDNWYISGYYVVNKN